MQIVEENWKLTKIQHFTVSLNVLLQRNANKSTPSVSRPIWRKIVTEYDNSIESLGLHNSLSSIVIQCEYNLLQKLNELLLGIQY